MTGIIPAVILLTLTCLFTLSAALPSMLSQSVSAPTKPTVPRSLLGKSYRTRWDSEDRPPFRWTIVADFDDPDHDHVATYDSRINIDGWTQAQMHMNTNANMQSRVPIPLPLVLNTFPNADPTRFRLIRSKRPIQHTLCTHDISPSEKAKSDGTYPRDEDEQSVRPSEASKLGTKQESRKVPVPVQRSKRLYEKGWKSRLLEEY